MRKTFFRLAQRVLAPRRATAIYQADFDDAAEMFVVARALRSHGFGARCCETPLRLVVTIPAGVPTRSHVVTVGGGR